MFITVTSSLVRLLGVIAYLTCFVYLIEHFTNSSTLQYIYSILGALLLLCALFFVSGLNRMIVILMIITGSIFFYIEGVSFSTLLLGFGENINLLSLFLLIPLIGIFMSVAGFLSTLKEKIMSSDKNKQPHPYRFSYLLTATIGVLLNFGSMAIVKKITEESFSSFREQKLTLNIMRAFASCMLWSPYFVNVGLVLVLFQLSWLDIGLFGLSLAVIYFIVSALFHRTISFSDDPIISESKNNDHYQTTKSLFPFFFFTCILVISSFLLDYLLDVNMITIVSLLAIVLPLIWSLFMKITTDYIQTAYEQVTSSFVRIKNEIAIFISAGFFGAALAETTLGEWITSFLELASFGSIYVLSLLIVFLSIALAQIGIHPIIIIIGIGSSLSPVQFGVSGEYFALLLLVAWTMATQLSPVSGQVLMASNLTNKPTITIVKQNLLFVFTLTFILTGALTLFEALNWL